jgi:uncharacterized phage protein gp47/JayE
MSSNYLDLISYGKQGIIVADYAKIREVLINRFKLIYGSDIDLSSTSADGQWIEEQSLFFNNILQMVKQFYANLDPRKASGEFLDIIASYTNVMRLPATRSNVSVLIEGLTPNISYTTNEPLVVEIEKTILNLEQEEITRYLQKEQLLLKVLFQNCL